MTEDNHADVADPLETRLKGILQLSVSLVKPRLKTKSQLAKLQDRLVDYHSNEELGEIIEDVLKILGQVLPRVKGIIEQEKVMIEQEQYLKLEQNLQSYEARVRAHIKNEHQLKLYCDDLQIKNKELEESKHDLVMSTKKTILELKRDNQELVTKIKQLQQKDSSIAEEKYRTTPERKGYQSHPAIHQHSENKILAKNHYKNPLAKKLESDQNHASRQNQKKNLMVLEHIEEQSKRKLDQYSSLGASLQPSRSRKGSVSSLKVRDKK